MFYLLPTSFSAFLRILVNPWDFVHIDQIIERAELEQEQQV